jgi:hypothetical protein
MLEGKGLDDLYKACMRALLALKCRGHICKWLAPPAIIRLRRM